MPDASEPPGGSQGPETQLWQLWRQGQRPDLARFLARFRPLRPADLVPVLLLDQRQRWQIGERTTAEAYLEKYPALRADSEAVVELVYGEFLLREELGPAPTLAEYLRRFPRHAERLRQQVQLHEALGDSSQEGTGKADPFPGSEDPTLLPLEPQPASGWPHVPGYEILEELGRGSMAVVYKARHSQLQRVVALKMLRGERTQAEFLDRFRREAQAIARLQHPHIIAVHEVGQAEGRPYIALEFCAGGNLARKLAGRRCDPQQAARLVQMLARAVHVAHQAGIIHRDLKPANVLLTERGIPKLTDFGLAKEIGGPSRTESGTVLGTPCYMAPEQASGKKQLVGPATDVYALGAVLYEALTGRPPFHGSTALTVVLQVLQTPPLPPSQLVPHLPPSLETICLKCLEKDPQRRYGSALDLADDLRRFLDHESVEAPPVPVPPRRTPWVGAVLVLLGGLVGLGLPAGSLWLAWHEHTGRVRAEAQRSQAQHAAAALALEHGQTLWAAGDAGPGLLWLAHSLEMAPPGNADLERSARSSLAFGRLTLRPLQGCLDQHGSVQAAAFSLDGKLLVTVGGDHSARCWDAHSGVALGLPLRHEDTVTAVALSGDGQRLVTGAGETAHVWDVVTGQPLGKPLLVQAPVRAVTFHGKAVVTAGGSKVVWWNPDTGRVLRSLTTPAGIESLAFSPDGERLLTTNEDGQAYVWDAETGSRLFLDHAGLGSPRNAVFAPDGQTLVTGATGEGVHLWDAPTGRLLTRAPMRHRGAVTAVAFRPDGKALVSGAEDGKVQVWNAATGQPLGPPLVHLAPVRTVAFSPDGSTLLTGCEDGLTRLWGEPSGAGGTVQAGKVPPAPGSVAQLVLQAQVQTGLELNAEGQVHCLDAATWKERRRQLVDREE